MALFTRTPLLYCNEELNYFEIENLSLIYEK